MKRCGGRAQSWSPNSCVWGRVPAKDFPHFLDYIPPSSCRWPTCFRDATAVIDALGWDPDTDPQRGHVEVPLTTDHIQQLHARRCDLLATNLDLLNDIGADNAANAIVMSQIYANRDGVEALTRIFDAYWNTITT